MLLAFQAPAAQAAVSQPKTIHLLVHFTPGTSAIERAAIARAVGGRIEGEIAPLRVTRVAITVEGSADPSSVLSLLAAQPRVGSVERDARVHVDWTPNDPYWSTDPYVGLGQWGDRKIGLERARDLVETLAPVVVAVIDTGVDAGHPDLAGVVQRGVTILSAQSVGCNADEVGTDDNSHGTHVAGIIAADANNAIGIAGVAPNARILPIKALDCTGSGSVSDIAEAIVYAVDHGARIINISLGASSDSTILEAAVQYAVDRDVLIVAAVGNCGSAGGEASRCFYTADLPEYPGASPGVLGVGATSSDDSIASFSTQGAQVALTAPGVRILSTTPHYPTYQSRRGAPMNYAVFSGTSQATPFVSGAAAMLLGVDPTLSATQVAERLRSSAVDLGAPGRDPAYGAGRLDLAHAVAVTESVTSASYDTSFVPRSVTAGASFVAKVALTNTSRTTWPASGAAAVELSYHWVDATGMTVVSDGVRTALPRDVPSGMTVTVDMNVVAPPVRGSYLLRVDLMQEGDGYFSGHGVSPGDVVVIVASGYAATYYPLTLYVWTPGGHAVPLVVTLRNTGTRTWSAGGANPVRLSYHWLANGVLTEWNGVRADLPNDVAPGETVTIDLPVIPPEGTAVRTLRLDLVQEGLQWFSDSGAATRDVLYVVVADSG